MHSGAGSKGWLSSAVGHQTWRYFKALRFVAGSKSEFPPLALFPGLPLQSRDRLFLTKEVMLCGFALLKTDENTLWKWVFSGGKGISPHQVVWLNCASLFGWMLTWGCKPAAFVSKLLYILWNYFHLWGFQITSNLNGDILHLFCLNVNV